LIQQLGQKSVAQNAAYFQRQLYGSGNQQGAYDLYNELYPSQALELQSTYYNFGSYGESPALDERDDD
jgi:hypothetical protein